MKTIRQQKRTLVMAAALGMGLAACEKNDRSFSLLSDSQTFKQDGGNFVQRKIDILWVVDNSGSMNGSQESLTNNFESFIERFNTLGFDYQMAVTSSEAFLADSTFSNTSQNPDYDPDLSLYSDGCTTTDCLGKTGIKIMTPDNTTTDVFKKNLKLGTAGSGDERAFSSFITALNDSRNKALGFPRAGAFLSIIVISDEDDFSGTATQRQHFNPGTPGYVGDHNYNVTAPKLQTVDYYIDLLNTTYGAGNFSVSAIYADTSACVTSLKALYNSTQIVGQRYADIAEKTKGVKGSLCSNFGETLSIITDNVLELSSVFALDRVPVPSSIVVSVDGSIVQQDAVNGWTYHSDTNSVQFHGTAIPAQGAQISINFDPVTAKN